jgi:hypothetical protein
MSILNINPKSSTFIRFSPAADAWLLNKVEIQLNRFFIDHESVKTGWGLMKEDSAPDWVWDNQLGDSGPQPTSEHKRGFSVRLYSDLTGTVTWSTTGTGPVIGFEKIFDEIWNTKDVHPDMVADVKYFGSKALKIGKGNTREPTFRIVNWVSRSAVPWDRKGSPPPEVSMQPDTAPRGPTNPDVEANMVPEPVYEDF